MLSPEKSTQEGWDELLKKTFPEGVLLTFCRTSPEAAGADDSPQRLVAGVRVVDFDEESPEVLWWDVATGAPYYLQVSEISELGEGRYDILLEDDRHVLASVNLPEQDRAAADHWIKMTAAG